MAVGNGFEEGPAVIELSDQPKDAESADEEAGLLKKNTAESSAYLTMAGANGNEEKGELPSSSNDLGGRDMGTRLHGPPLAKLSTHVA